MTTQRTQKSFSERLLNHNSREILACCSQHCPLDGLLAGLGGFIIPPFLALPQKKPRRGEISLAPYNVRGYTITPNPFWRYFCLNAKIMTKLFVVKYVFFIPFFLALPQKETKNASHDKAIASHQSLSGLHASFFGAGIV